MQNNLESLKLRHSLRLESLDYYSLFTTGHHHFQTMIKSLTTVVTNCNHLDLAQLGRPSNSVKIYLIVIYLLKIHKN